MDKTIQIVVVAMIAIVTALIILFLVQGETDNFEGFLDSQKDDAECRVARTQAENACPNKQRVREILDQNECLTASTCNEFCDQSCTESSPPE